MILSSCRPWTVSPGSVAAGPASRLTWVTTIPFLFAQKVREPFRTRSQHQQHSQLVSCVGPDPTCEATEISSDQVSGGSGAEASSIVAWAESLAVYSAFAWVLAIAFALFACGSIALRRCCCCCCGRYGTCGQTQPTRKGDGCFKLGFHVFPVPTVGEKGSFRGAVAPAGQDGELLGPLAQEQLALSRVRYPAHSKWGSRVCLGLYVFFVVVFVILGNEKGNFALTEAQKSLAAAPTGIMQSIQSMTQPLNALVINMADRVAASSLRDINSTITAAVDVRLLALDTQCLRDGFSDDLPDPSAGERFIGSKCSSYGLSLVACCCRSPLLAPAHCPPPCVQI